MSMIPMGTITFLFTDLEGSTRLWETQPDAMRIALAQHDALLRAALTAHGGHVFKTVGDAFYAAFSNAPDALAAALAIQRGLAAQAWAVPMRVRVGLHTGAAESRDGDYFGQPLNRVARIMSAGHGGQILVSQATMELVRDTLPDGCALRDLGERRLKDLIRPERIFQVVVSDLPDDFPPLRTLDSRPNNLPAQPTPFMGRERELAHLRDLIGSGARLVTLTGVGGTGKTRLSLQLAADLLDQFSDGVFFVALAQITDPNRVVETINDALRVEGGGDSLDALKAHLHDRHLLLVLDNMEQVMSAAPIVADVLAAAPRLTVVVTSREALRVYGEREVHIPPLALPDPKRREPLAVVSQYEAVALFIERARAVQDDFAISEANAPAIAEICVRLDGLPLAIELAAARVRLFTPAQMLDRLTSRLKTLTGGARDLPARQQTLRAAIEWSDHLLSEDERRLFYRLGVFVGGFTLDAAETICNADLDVLDNLLGKSLIRRIDERFTMLETIREYALERLAATGDAVRRAHAAYFLAYAEAGEAGIRSPEQLAWMRRLSADHDNVRAALAYYHDQPDGADSEARIVGAVGFFLFMQGYFREARAHVWALRPRLDQVDLKVRAAVLNTDGYNAHGMGEYADANHSHQQALAIYRALGDTWHIVYTLWCVSAQQQKPADERLYLDEALPLARQLDDPWLLSGLLVNMANLYSLEGRTADAAAASAEGIRLARACGNLGSLQYHLGNSAEGVLRAGRLDEAAQMLDEALAIAEQLGDRRMEGAHLSNLARLAQLRGDLTTAHSLIERAMAISEAIRDLPNYASCQYQLALLVETSDPAQAFRLSRAALRYFTQTSAFERTVVTLPLVVRLLAAHDPALSARLFGALAAHTPAGYEPADDEQQLIHAAQTAIRGALGDDAYATLFEQGKPLTLAQAALAAAEQEYPL